MSESDARVPFGRARNEGPLVDLGCPECPGVLEARSDGHKGFLSFVCRIGHAYSPQSLVDAKEEALEDAFWSVAVRLDELASVYADFAPRMEALGQPGLAAAYRARLELIRALLPRARALAEGNRRPAERALP